MFGLIFGNPLVSLVRGPCAVLAVVGMITALCGCIRCSRWSLRDIALIKHLYLWIGQDKFDDFELIMFVHEAMFEKQGKTTTYVNVKAGAHCIRTEESPSHIFQQPLHIIVEQGVETIVVELMDTRHTCMATLHLDVLDQIITPKVLNPEVVYFMKQKAKGVLQPKIQLTMVVNNPDDAASGLVDHGALSSDVDLLVRQQLLKARRQHGDEEVTSELDVLKDACAGPLEIFQGMGRSNEVHVAVIGPPISRRWVLGVWRDQESFANKEKTLHEVDLMKIESIQADPKRNHVFVVNFFDELRNRNQMTFRRVDRARDVWVEILHLMIMKAREVKTEMKLRSTQPAMFLGSGVRSTQPAMFLGSGARSSTEPSLDDPTRSTMFV